jgi:hypothetical protein
MKRLPVVRGAPKPDGGLGRQWAMDRTDAPRHVGAEDDRKRRMSPVQKSGAEVRLIQAQPLVLQPIRPHHGVAD